MRTKAGLLVVALALLVVTAAPAAKAGAVTYVDEGGAIENEAEVFLHGGKMQMSGTITCEKFAIDTTMLENAADPAILQEAPGSLTDCYLTNSPSVKIYPNNVEIGQITLGSNNKGSMPIEFGYTTNNPEGWGYCPHMQGTIGVNYSSWPSRALNYYGLVASTGYPCVYGSELAVSGSLPISSNNGPAEVKFP